MLRQTFEALLHVVLPLEESIPGHCLRNGLPREMASPDVYFDVFLMRSQVLTSQDGSLPDAPLPTITYH